MRLRFLIFLFAVISTVSLAQNRANWWHFGYGGGIDFSDLANPVSISSSIGNILEGTSSMSDVTGNLLMYTDGANIYDRNGDLMVNGTGLGGDGSSVQSGLIIPNPANDDLYYVFSQSGEVAQAGATGLKYSIVDVTEVGNGTVTVPLGDVTGTKAVSLISNTMQNCAAVPDRSGGYWVVTRALTASGDFYAFHIDGTTGVLNTTPVTSGAGSGPTTGASAISTLKFSPCSDRLAYVAKEYSKAEIWEFDNTTGQVGLLEHNITSVTAVYSCEFSPSGQYFYANSLTTGTIWQYDLNNASPQTTQFTVGSTSGVGQHGTMQIGPDGNIYIAATQNAPVALSVINDPDNGGAACNFVQNGFPLTNSTLGRLGLPPFVSSFVNNVVQFDFSEPCVNTQIDFSFTFSGAIQAGSVLWDFAGEATSGLDNPSHTFTSPGDYTVTLSVTDDVCGETKSISQVITVGPASISDPVLAYCPGETTQLTMGDGNSYCFYENSNETGLIGCGDTVDHIFTGSGTETVYVNIETFSGATFGPTDVTQTDLGAVSTDYQDFTVVTELTLVSFEVESGFSNLTNNVWEIRNSSNALVATGTITAAANSRFVVNVNTTLLPDDYQLSFDIKSFKFSPTPDREDVGVIQFAASSWNDYLANPYTGYLAANWVVEPPQEPWCSTLPITIDQTAAALCCTSPGASVAILGATNDTIKACDNTTIDANISGGGSVFQWYVVGGATLGAEGGVPGATETSPTISASGYYEIRVADNSAGLAGCADGDTVYVLITATPGAPTVTTPVEICTGEALAVEVTSPDADYIYNWTGPNTYTATGANPTVIASATLTPTDYSGTYSVTATENGCTGTGTDVTVRITQGPTIASVNVDTSFCAYNFDLSLLHGAASNGAITYHGDAPGYANLGGSTVSADGTYHLVVTDAGCADTIAVATTATGDPSASWAGGSGVCAGNSTDLTLTITGGTGTFTAYYDDGTSTQTQAGLSTGDAISLGAGTYTLDSVVDNNGCSHLNIGDTETISTQADVDATVTTLCDGDLGVNGVLNFDEFQLMVDITAGDTANVTVEEVAGTFGINFTEVPANSGLWFSDPIKEDTTLDIRVRDTRCDTVTGSYNRVCSCPGVITISGDTAICNNGEAELTLTLDGVGPFDFELQQNGTVYNGATLLGVPYGGSQTNVPLLGSPTTVTIVVADSGTYTIADLIDNGSGACEGSEIGSELVAFYTHPDGDIGLDPTTGENPICLDDDTDVDINVTAGGVGPFTAYYTDNGTQSTGATTGTGIGTINITADTGTVVLDSIVDVNGCASPINESLTITAHDTLDVTATIVCDDDAATPGLPNDGFYIEVTTATGIIDAVSETSANGLTFTNSAGTWTSGVTNETNSVDISVTDDNGCHTVTITGLQQTCSCPTAAVLGYATNGEACEGGAGIVLEIDTTAGSMNWTNATVTVTGPNGVELNAVTVPSIPHQFTVADSGEYTLTVFTDNGEGCNAQLNDDTATAVIYSLPTGTLTGGSVPCIGGTADAINLYLTGAGSSWNVDYTQTNSSGTVADDDNIITSAGTSTLENATSTPADSGTYTITSIEMTAGNVTCTATDLGNTSYIGFTTPPSVSITGGGTYCDTEAPDTIIATITAGSSGIPNWTLVYYEDGAAITSRVTATTNPYNFITSTDLQIRIDSIYEGTCGAQVTGEDETITYVATPIPSITVISDTCEGSQVTAIANVTNTYAGMVYNWDVDGVTASETYPDSNYSFTINLPATGTTVPVNLSVDAPAACGSATQTATTQNITVTGQHGATITTGDLDICKDSVGTLVANDEGTGVSYTWTLNTNSVSTTSSVGVTNTPGVYTLTTSSAECPDRTATATVTVTEIIVTAVASQTLVSEGDAVTLSTVTNGTSCEWYDPSLLSIGSNCTESITPITPGGIYTVMSTDGQCVGTDQIEVLVIQPIKVPDAFTPNGDGINDEFTITGISTYAKASVAVYNRWGNVVFYIYGGDKYDATPWDGTMNGKELPAGVYYYTIDLGLDESESELVPDAAPKSGSVMLLK